MIHGRGRFCTNLKLRPPESPSKQLAIRLRDTRVPSEDLHSTSTHLFEKASTQRRSPCSMPAATHRVFALTGERLESAPAWRCQLWPCPAGPPSRRRTFSLRLPLTPGRPSRRSIRRSQSPDAASFGFPPALHFAVPGLFESDRNRRHA